MTLTARTATQIIADAAILYGVSESDIVGPRRFKRIVEARWAVMASLDHMGWTTTRIGKRLNRDHTTILHGLGRLRS